jgi:hypothetical protein
MGSDREGKVDNNIFVRILGARFSDSNDVAHISLCPSFSIIASQTMGWSTRSQVELLSHKYLSSSLNPSAPPWEIILIVRGSSATFPSIELILIYGSTIEFFQEHILCFLACEIFLRFPTLSQS